MARSRGWSSSMNLLIVVMPVSNMMRTAAMVAALMLLVMLQTVRKATGTRREPSTAMDVLSLSTSACWEKSSPGSLNL